MLTCVQVDNFVTLVHNSIPVPVVSIKRPTDFTWDPASSEVFSRFRPQPSVQCDMI